MTSWLPVSKSTFYYHYSIFPKTTKPRTRSQLIDRPGRGLFGGVSLLLLPGAGQQADLGQGQVLAVLDDLAGVGPLLGAPAAGGVCVEAGGDEGADDAVGRAAGEGLAAHGDLGVQEGGDGAADAVDQDAAAGAAGERADHARLRWGHLFGRVDPGIELVQEEDAHEQDGAGDEAHVGQKTFVPFFGSVVLREAGNGYPRRQRKRGK
ncbi:hypothetical protein BX600DRAFT_90483 [Xylariales sp. PMI_506]|nr:hypothetical protein BX600DRAFT_90483 [Xylariales sp. PMI_506]